MSAKIINPHRYKKISKTQAQKNKKNINSKRYSTNLSKKNSLKYNKEKLKNIKENKQISSEKRKREKNKQVYIPKTLVVVLVVFALVLVGFLSRKIVNFDNLPILNVFSNKEENKNLVKDYDYKIGISKLDTTNTMLSNNVILNELFLKTTIQLVSINQDYTINYKGASSVEKQNNKEYIIELAPEYDLSINDVKNSINKIKEAGAKNVYFKNVSNIISADEYGSGKLKFMLKSEDPYFVYTLDFPIFKDTMSEYNVSNTTQSSVEFKKNKSTNSIQNITLSNYSNTDSMVGDFRDNKIDMFFSSTDSVMQLIGKHDYNVKKYRDGETIFLFGNKNSKLFSQKEVRQALAYSMNREEIVKGVNNSFGEVIDLPYIYSGIMYKYDVYGANNALLSNGWTKTNIYSKKIDGQNINLELKLVVNEQDETKVKIADIIKEKVEPTGIKINVVKLSQDSLKNALANGEYDIVLSTVYINQNPDITYIEEYLNINEVTNSAIQKVKSSSIDALENSVKELQSVLSSEVACIGIMARNVNIVYQKDVTGFENTNYMKIFENLQYIGKSIEK